MELDKLKKTWEKVYEIDSKPSDEQILNLLKSSNKSILNRIISIETIAFRAAFILPVLSLFVSLFYYFLIPKTGVKAFYTFYMFLVFSGALLIWTSYKLKYLKKIDIMNSDILSISKFINKYRYFSIYESVVSLIWGIMFVFILLNIVSTVNSIFEYLLFGGLAFVLVVLGFLFARLISKDTIGVIKRNLEEMRAFEKEESF